MSRWRALAASHPGVIGGLALVAVTVIAAVAVVWLSPYDPNAAAVTDRLQPPSVAHPFGTDSFGRDLLTRVAVGVWMSFQIGIAVSVLAVTLGLLLGLVAAFVPWLDQLIMRLCDGLLAIPGILLALAVVAATGASVGSLILCLIVVETPGVVRLVRARALSVRERAYVEAARASGVREAAVIVRHVLPAVIVPIAVQASAVFAAAIIIEAALSFLGAGVPAPTASLGNLLSEAKGFIYTGWWMTLFPGLALAALVLGANLAGDGVGGHRRTGRWFRRSASPSVEVAS